MSGNPFQRELDWFGLYTGDTSRDDMLFTPASVRHPAKMSLSLLYRIFDELKGLRLLAPGSTVVDPFGGRGTTAAVWAALDARNHAVTIEIEPDFALMQHENRWHASRRLGRMLRWTILRGDAREADRLLKDAGVCVTSPPYAGTSLVAEMDRSNLRALNQNEGDGKSYGKTHGQIATLPDSDTIAITSPPYGQGVIGKGGIDAEALVARCPSLKGRDPNGAWFQALQAGYVNSPGNIDNLPDVAVTSPPYGDSLNGGEGPGARYDFKTHSAGNARTATSAADYGDTPGQIGTMPDPVAITSPPYGQTINGRNGIDLDKLKRFGQGRKSYGANSQAVIGGYGESDGQIENLPDGGEVTLHWQGPSGEEYLFTGPAALEAEARTFLAQAGAAWDEAQSVTVTSPPYEAQSGGDGTQKLPDAGVAQRCGYKTSTNGDTEGQIGTEQGETYASACLQVYQALARAGVGVVVTVTKNPTRNGKLRRLDKLTANLLKAAGYRVVGWRRAWLFMTPEEVAKAQGQAPLITDTAKSRRVVGRVSFFKRLAIAKGGVAAQWEDVFIAVLVNPPPPQAETPTTQPTLAL